MSYLVKSISNIAKLCLGNNFQGNTSSLLRNSSFNKNTVNTSLVKHFSHSNSAATLWNTGKLIVTSNIMKSVNAIQGLSGLQFIRGKNSLYQIHKRGPLIKKRTKPRPLDGNPFLKGVVLRTLIKKPKKPNSANRKCVLVRLSNGKEMTAYVPGVGHNLQEHNIVLVKVGRTQDVPGLKIKCVRGKYDLPHPIKRTK